MSDEMLERSTIRTISWRLLPLICAGYLISYMDRVNISFAALQMNADLHFTGAVYGFGGGLFFISYALLEVPSNLLLVRFGARRWLARIMLTWGALAMGMMFVRTPWQFYAMRFALGAAEAGFFPGVIYYLGLWFPQAYRGRAITRFYVAWPLSSVVMGALAGVLLGLRGKLGLAGWQWLLLVEGAPAVMLSVVFWRLLRDSPDEAAWLTAAQKAWLKTRLAADANQAAAPDHSVLRALTRPPVLAFAAANFLVLGPFYAFTLSAPALLLASTGWSVGQVGYLTAACGLTGAAAMLANGWDADRTNEGFVHLAIAMLAMTLGFGLVASVHTPLGAITGYLIAMTANAAYAGTFWVEPSRIIHPRVMAASAAAINGVGQLGSFLFPWLWGLSKDATGSYQTGLNALPFAYLAAAAIILGLRQTQRRRSPSPQAGRA